MGQRRTRQQCGSGKVALGREVSKQGAVPHLLLCSQMPQYKKTPQPALLLLPTLLRCGVNQESCASCQTNNRSPPATSQQLLKASTHCGQPYSVCPAPQSASAGLHHCLHCRRCRPACCCCCLLLRGLVQLLLGHIWSASCVVLRCGQGRVCGRAVMHDEQCAAGSEQCARDQEGCEDSSYREAAQLRCCCMGCVPNARHIPTKPTQSRPGQVLTTPPAC